MFGSKNKEIKATKWELMPYQCVMGFVSVLGLVAADVHPEDVAGGILSPGACDTASCVKGGSLFLFARKGSLGDFC